MRIDHLSVGTSVHAIEAFGLRVTPSPGRGHARMHLGGVYLEISGLGPEPDGATAATWYLGPADMSDCVRELRRRGLTLSQVTPYRGRDGRWLDAHISAPALGNAVPVLTRRPTTRPWPPPFGLSFADATGRVVLSEVPGGGQSSAVLAPVPQLQAGANTPPGPALYAPLTFTVGAASPAQEPAGQFQGNLVANLQGGIEYAALRVIAVASDGAGARLTVSTSDPGGTRLAVSVVPRGSGAFAVSVRPAGGNGPVAVMDDSFTSPAGEEFHGFGGRHNALDQHGNQFLNWLQQENVSAGAGQPVAGATPGNGGSTYLFPNGPEAAYYVQSSFVSSAGYGFLLDRNEISDWRMASDRSDAWRVSSAGAGLDYSVVPGDLTSAVGDLTALTGRQAVPPAWATGTLLDRGVKSPSDSAANYLSEVRSDIANVDRYRFRSTVIASRGGSSFLETCWPESSPSSGPARSIRWCTSARSWERTTPAPTIPGCISMRSTTGTSPPTAAVDRTRSSRTSTRAPR